MGKITAKKRGAVEFSRPSSERGIDESVAAEVSAPAVTRGMKAGKYIRLTLTVRDDQLKRIRDELPLRWATELEEMTGWPVKVSSLEIGRWLLDQGLAAWDDGKRPSVPVLKARSDK